MEEFWNSIWDRLAEVWDWFGVKENRERATAIAQVIATLVVAVAAIWAFIKLCVPRLFKTTAIKDRPTDAPHLEETIRSVLERELNARGLEVDEKLSTASEGERARLEAEKAEIARRLADVEGALKEREEKIHKLEALLDRAGNEIGGDRLAEARAALRQGDFSKADDLFAEIEAREQMAVQSAARAAYGRGEIAEEQVRWADAAAHYGRAAGLDQTFDTLYKAREFAWRAGDNTRAAGFGEELIRVAREEFGDESTELATALNEHALTIDALGKYAEAESLYRQALEIGEKTIGTEHPNYAIRLNNLANLLHAMGRHDEAEPLYRQALEIDANTIGTEHPDYATRLSNLALLLHDKGRHGEAGPLYVEALEILRAKLGPDHPNTKKVEANYATFLAERSAAAPE